MPAVWEIRGRGCQAPFDGEVDGAGQAGLSPKRLGRFGGLLARQPKDARDLAKFRSRSPWATAALGTGRFLVLP